MKLGVNPYTSAGKAYYDKFKEKGVLSKLRLKVYERYDQKCPICQESLQNGERVELHHIKATHEGGKTVINNLMPLH
jgi:RNA-directed DNA polymerase